MDDLPAELPRQERTDGHARPRPRVDPVDIGGDPVCWAPRVCPDCGLFVPVEPPTTCPRCGADVGVE